MDENPYRAPQSQPEPPPLLGLWRRSTSSAAVVIGVCGSVGFSLVLYASCIVISSHAYIPTDRKLGLVVSVAVSCISGPCLVLAGLAFRKIVRWRHFAIASMCVAVALVIYLAWWWNQVRVPPWPN
jgi:hypothetical protein